MKNKLYILMGKSATGKDTLYRELRKRHPGLAPVIPYTTRPIREGEVPGESYIFVTEEKMRDMEKTGRVIESRCYHTVKGDWYYFTADDEQLSDEIKAMDITGKIASECDGVSGNREDALPCKTDSIKNITGHIMITTLEGYEKLRDYFGKDKVVPIYIEVDDITRMERALDRERLEDKPCVAELCRRYLADEEDFSTERLNGAGIGSGISNITIEEAIAAIEKKMFDN